MNLHAIDQTQLRDNIASMARGAQNLISTGTVAAPPDPVLASTVIDAFAEAPMDLDGDLGADGDPTAFLTDDALAELVGEALAPGAGPAMVTPEASPGLTPCGCRIQPTQFFQ